MQGSYFSDLSNFCQTCWPSLILSYVHGDVTDAGKRQTNKGRCVRLSLWIDLVFGCCSLLGGAGLLTPPNLILTPPRSIDTTQLKLNGQTTIAVFIFLSLHHNQQTTRWSLYLYLDFCDDNLRIQITERQGRAMYHHQMGHYCELWWAGLNGGVWGTQFFSCSTSRNRNLSISGRTKCKRWKWHMGTTIHNRSSSKLNPAHVCTQDVAIPM